MDIYRIKLKTKLLSRLKKILTNSRPAYEQCSRLLPFNAQFRITLKLGNFKESQFNANQVGAVFSNFNFHEKLSAKEFSTHKIL